MASGSNEISNLISKLTLAHFIQRNKLPTLRQACVHPSTSTSSSSSNQSSSNPLQNAQSVPWSGFLQNSHTPATPPTKTFSSFYQEISPNRLPRLVFFGEQHHQPSVLRSQLQALYDYHTVCKEAAQLQPMDLASSETESRQKSRRRTIYRPNLILEQFSLISQSSLSKFQTGEIDFNELNQEYLEKSKEDFQLQHYAPLLLLARELDIKIWAGFPERTWAKIIMKEGVEQVKTLEKDRLKAIEGKGMNEVEDQDQNQNQNVIPEFTQWEQVMNLGQDHRAFLKGLMNPDKPIRFPALENGQDSSSSSPYPASRLPIPPPESKGFSPAQALKDSYFAHVISKVLKDNQDQVEEKVKTKDSSSIKSLDEPTSAAPNADSDSDEDRNQEVEIVNTVFAICGSGHCEFGLGTPERCVTFLQDSGREIDPVIITSKPRDSEVWLGPEYNETDEEDQATIGRESLRWKESGWERKLADLVVLYDWVD